MTPYEIARDREMIESMKPEYMCMEWAFVAYKRWPVALTEVERLRDEIAHLKAENTELLTKVERLRALLLNR